jgi:uncharacterized membrane protein
VTGSGGLVADPAPEPAVSLERSIARLLTIGTYASVALLVLGVVLMLATGIAPRSGGPAFDITKLVSDLLALRPAGFIWLGLVAVVATPAARVLTALIGYARRRDRTMAIVAALILVVIALSVALAQGLGS